MVATRNKLTRLKNKGIESMDAVILCGGLGKRLRSVLGKSQKVMAKVGQKPFMDIILQYLRNNKFKRIVLCTGYQGHLVKKYYSNNKKGMDILFSPEQKPLGTGGAIKNASKKVKSETFLVLNGDSFCPLNLKKFIKFHKTQKALATVAVYPQKKNVDSGRIKMDKKLRILSFDEKKKSSRKQYVNAGVYCFDQSIFRKMPKRKVFSLEYDLFPSLIKQKFFAFPTKQEFLDIGTPERYDKAQKFLRKKGRRK